MLKLPSHTSQADIDDIFGTCCEYLSNPTGWINAWAHRPKLVEGVTKWITWFESHGFCFEDTHRVHVSHNPCAEIVLDGGWEVCNLPPNFVPSMGFVLS